MFWSDYAFAYNQASGRRPYDDIVIGIVPILISLVVGVIVAIRPQMNWGWSIPLILVYSCLGSSGLNSDNSADDLHNAIQVGWSSFVVLSLVILAWLAHREKQSLE